MEETKNYESYRTVCPLVPEYIVEYENEIKPSDREFQVVVFGTVCTTLQKGTILKLNRRFEQKITSLEQIEGLDKLTELSTLDLSGQKIADISGLVKFKKLKNLYLTGNTNIDLSPLENLSNLEKLVIKGLTYPKNVESVGKLKNLTTLILRRFNDSIYSCDISFLRELVNLRELDLEGNQIKTVKSLYGLVKLKRLNLSCNQIETIDAFKYLTDLEDVNLEQNRIQNILPLRKLRNLKELNISNNPILSYDTLKELNFLYQLTVDINGKRMVYNTELQIWNFIENQKAKRDCLASIKNPEVKITGKWFKKYSISWDCIWFGNYPQKKCEDGSFMKEPICWRVLNVEKGKAILLSNVILDAEQVTVRKNHKSNFGLMSGAYSINIGDVADLLEKFYVKAFSEIEKKALISKPRKINLMEDRMIAFSHNSKYGFNDSGKAIELACVSEYSEYAVSKGLYAGYRYGKWLIETSTGNLSFVDEFGCRNRRGIANTKIVGIRPYIVVDLDKLELERFESRYVKVIT